MGEILSTVTRKGQVTLPIEIRKRLGISKGDKVAILLVEDKVILRPVRSVAELTFGAVKPRWRPEDFQELRRQFEEGMAEEAAAESRPTADKP